MTQIVGIRDFNAAVDKILKKYGDDLTEVTKRLVKKAGSEARDKLKQKSPKRTGKYAAGWTTAEFMYDALGAHVIVHNKKKPGVAHLLENGHVKRNGGRAPAYVHIKPVEGEVCKTLEDGIKKAIGNVNKST